MATRVAKNIQAAATAGSDQTATNQNGSETDGSETVDLVAMGQAARSASRTLATLTTAHKNEALAAIAQELEAQSAAIMGANAQDLADGRGKGLTDALLDRLMLNEARISSLADDTRKIIDLPDPVGTELES